jgi:sigma-B regulation protein RsbQ
MDHNILKRHNVNVSGRGTQYMIFASGFGCDQNMWRFVAPAFEDKYRVVLFDYVGSGKSDLMAYSPRRYIDLAGYVQDLLDVCKAMDIKEAVFVGHSVGCMIGMLAAIREPERFERLVLIAPSPCYINHLPDYTGGFERADLEGLIALMEQNYIAWARLLAPVMMNNPGRPSLARELQDCLCAIDPIIARQFAIATFFADNRKELPAVPIPSLILQCAEDSIAPVEVGQYIHRHLPRSRLQMMQAIGHCPHMSQPEETIRWITDYLTVPMSKLAAGRKSDSGF